MPADDELNLSAETLATWRLAPQVALHFRRWDHDWLLFDEGSGQTHQIDTLTALGLMVLEAGPATPAAIAGAVRRELALEPEESGEIENLLPDILEQLRQLGLVIGVAP